MKEYKKIKITFLINKLVYGGVATFLVNILNSLDSKKYNIKLIVFQGNNDILNEINSNIKVQVYSAIKKDNIEQFLSKNFLLKIIKLFYFVLREYLDGSKIYKLIKSNIKKDEILVNVNIRNLATTIAIKHFKNIKIGWSHADILNDIKILPINNINYLLYKNYNRIISVSKTSMGNFQKKYPSIKHEYLYNFLNNKKFKSLYEEDFKNNTQYILGVGRLSSEKGFKILISAYSQLNDEIKNKYKLIIIGDGPEKKNLEKLIITNCDSNNISLLGYVKNPIKYIKNSQLLVSSSFTEGFSIVILEAMKCGIPVVSTNCIGPYEILEGGKYGLITKIGDINSLKISIEKIINDKSLYSGIKKGISKKINDFSEEKIIKKFDNIIKSLK